MRKNDFERTTQYLEYFSRKDPERKRREALVNSKTGKRAEAYRAYEELIFTGYQHIQMTLNDLRILYMEDGGREMAEKLVEVSSAAASAFEMGRYHEVCFGLDVAVWEKDAPRTARTVQEILESAGSIGDCARSKLYQHMTMKNLDPEFAAGLRREILQSLEDETFAYMRGNEEWEKLKNDASREDI